ncbi:DNA polymerase III subunit gamma and tau [Corynebacterium matruchotii]|uniref:DNA polymerase III subunit gamma and tau n=1 Tax=Corynebacterium matruchotii TaxID=43768 RepID=UPI0028E55E7A|nr:DNA polymerase III subunit gamma and tau [Corynebacterium matruchotii]
MALYRKYRPGSFNELVGQEQVTVPLSAALDNGRINHAYLFSGPRGCGKTSSARIMARSLNCVNGPTSKPCGKCNSCVSLAANGPGNLDVTELDAASHNGVDDMRELRDRAMFAPAESRYRIFIIDEAHMITNQGSNALLKIVEEPPAHLIFIFATTEPEKVIGTIRSRTHHYPFRLLTPQAMRGLLERTVAAEGAIIEESVYPLVIRAGGGSPRDTLSILDQLLAGTGPDGLTYQYARMLLGVTDDTLIDATIAALATNDRASLFTTVDDVIEAGLSPRKFSEDLLDRLRDLMLLQAVPDAVNLGLVDAPTDRGEILLQQAQEFDSQRIPRIAGILNDGLSSLKGATSPRLLLEILCAKMLIEPGGQVAPAPVLSAPSARPTPAAPASIPSSKYERPSQRRVREAQEARNVAEKPEVVEAVAEAKPRESEESPETRSTPAGAASTSVHVQPIDTIKNAWDKIRSTVSKTNAVAGILLTGAQPLGIADETLVLGHNTGALASRLNAPEHNATIQSAVLETTGLELEVRCEVGTNPKAFGFETDNPKPVWNPEQDAGEAGSAGDAQETATQEAESANPVAAEQAEPEPAPEPEQPEPAPEPAKSDADSESAQSPEAAEPEATPLAPGPALEVAPEPAPPSSPAPAAPEDTWGEPARLGGAPESAPDMPKPDSAAVPEDASEAGTNPAAQPSQPPSAASPTIPAAPAAESATSIWGQPAQLGGGGGPTHQPTHQPTYQAQPAQPAHERPAPQAQTQPQPSVKPTTSTWRERARRGNKLLAEQQNAPRFSDGTPAPPEPSEPWDAPPPPPLPAEVPEMSAPELGAEAGFGAGAAPVPGAAPGQRVPPAPKGVPEPPEQRESVVSAAQVGPAGPASHGASAPTTSLASASAASAAPARSSQNAAPAPSSAPDSGPGAGTAGAPTSNAPSHRRTHHQHHQSRQHHRPGDEEAEMMHQAATELGEHDHRDAMTIAISLVEQELGGRVV